MNTELNAGTGHRRTSSNTRGNISRQQSLQTPADGQLQSTDESGQRLKWDEANLYLNEGQMGGKMKIDEPKTPYAGHYDPAEDADAISALNAEELNVDELDLEKSKHANHVDKSRRESDIPGLDLGEPEMEQRARRESDGERKVMVDSDDQGTDGVRHGEAFGDDMSSEEREKHQKFEEMRKRHYEMSNIKDLLG